MQMEYMCFDSCCIVIHLARVGTSIIVTYKGIVMCYCIALPVIDDRGHLQCMVLHPVGSHGHDDSETR